MWKASWWCTRKSNQISFELEGIWQERYKQREGAEEIQVLSRGPEVCEKILQEKRTVPTKRENRVWTLHDHDKPLSFWEQDQSNAISILTFAFILQIIIKVKTIKEKNVRKFSKTFILVGTHTSIACYACMLWSPKRWRTWLFNKPLKQK